MKEFVQTKMFLMSHNNPEPMKHVIEANLKLGEIITHYIEEILRDRDRA
jgi:hypothetical protein